MTNQKGFANTILVVVIIILAGIGGYYFLKKPAKVVVSPTPTATPTVTVNPTANWKTYTNNQYGYEFKYPNNYSVSTTGSTNIASLVSSPYVSIEVRNYQILNLTGGKPIAVGGIAAIKFPAGGNRDGGVEYQIDVPSKKLTILFNGRNSSSHDYISEYDKILSTFKFTSPINGWKTYQNTKYGFEFQYPKTNPLSGLDLLVEGEPTAKSVIIREDAGLARVSVDIFDNPQNESPRAFAAKDYPIYNDPALVKTDLLIGNNAALSLKHPDLSGITYYISQNNLMIRFGLDLGQQTNQQIISGFKFAK